MIQPSDTAGSSSAAQPARRRLACAASTAMRFRTCFLIAIAAAKKKPHKCESHEGCAPRAAELGGSAWCDDTFNCLPCSHFNFKDLSAAVDGKQPATCLFESPPPPPPRSPPPPQASTASHAKVKRSRMPQMPRPPPPPWWPDPSPSSGHQASFQAQGSPGLDMKGLQTERDSFEVQSADQIASPPLPSIPAVAIDGISDTPGIIVQRVFLQPSDNIAPPQDASLALLSPVASPSLPERSSSSPPLSSASPPPPFLPPPPSPSPSRLPPPVSFLPPPTANPPPCGWKPGTRPLCGRTCSEETCGRADCSCSGCIFCVMALLSPPPPVRKGVIARMQLRQAAKNHSQASVLSERQMPQSSFVAALEVGTVIASDLQHRASDPDQNESDDTLLGLRAHHESPFPLRWPPPAPTKPHDESNAISFPTAQFEAPLPLIWPPLPPTETPIEEPSTQPAASSATHLSGHWRTVRRSVRSPAPPPSPRHPKRSGRPNTHGTDPRLEEAQPITTSGSLPPFTTPTLTQLPLTMQYRRSRLPDVSIGPYSMLLMGGLIIISLLGYTFVWLWRRGHVSFQYPEDGQRVYRRARRKYDIDDDNSESYEDELDYFYDDRGCSPPCRSTDLNTPLRTYKDGRDKCVVLGESDAEAGKEPKVIDL